MCLSCTDTSEEGRGGGHTVFFFGNVKVVPKTPLARLTIYSVFFPFSEGFIKGAVTSWEGIFFFLCTFYFIEMSTVCLRKGTIKMGSLEKRF